MPRLPRAFAQSAQTPFATIDQRSNKQKIPRMPAPRKRCALHERLHARGFRRGCSLDKILSATPPGAAPTRACPLRSSSQLLAKARVPYSNKKQEDSEVRNRKFLLSASGPNP